MQKLVMLCTMLLLESVQDEQLLFSCSVVLSSEIDVFFIEFRIIYYQSKKLLDLKRINYLGEHFKIYIRKKSIAKAKKIYIFIKILIFPTQFEHLQFALSLPYQLGMQQVQMLFIQKGKLSQLKKPSELTGELHIKDKDNLATIIGDFTLGRCESADIYRHQQNKISNISVHIHENGVVYMGGKQVKEYKYKTLIYEGGYLGYKRNGFGTHYFLHFEHQKKESGIWINGVCPGEAIEEYVDQKKLIFTILRPQSSPSVQQFQIRLNAEQLLITKKPQGRKQIKQLTLLKDREYWKNYMAERKQQWKGQPRQLMKALYEQPIKKIQKFSHEQLRQEWKLSLDMVETYIKCLYHTPEYQSNGRTVMFGIYTALNYNKIYQINATFQTKDRNNSKDEVNHLMLQYRNKYCIFRGYWKYIIIPLVLSEKYNHFSFVRITIDQDKLTCVYYDSILYQNYTKMLQLYLPVIKSALIHELLKDSNNQKRKQHIQHMVIDVYKEFPQQSQNDKMNCGFYMLQGIADLMKNGKIDFQRERLRDVKRDILQKLKELSFKGSAQK